MLDDPPGSCRSCLASGTSAPRSLYPGRALAPNGRDRFIVSPRAPSLGGLDGDTARQTDSRWFNVRVTFAGGEGNAQSGVSQGWSEDDTGLHRDFRFSDFATAWRFMGLVAAEAERMDHHPDWSNSYDRVSITLISHDKGRVTGRDHRLAALIDDIFAAVSKIDR